MSNVKLEAEAGAVPNVIPAPTVKYEDITKANELIKTITISRYDKKAKKTINKEYAEVNQRVKAFRCVYPQGTISTEILSNDNGVVVMRATVRDELGKVIGTGLAYEKENSSFINEGSYIENCETSAVGRALGFCGFGIEDSISSADELGNAINNQEPTDDTDYNILLNGLIKEHELDKKEIAKEYKLNAKSTNEDFKKVYNTLIDKLEKETKAKDNKEE